MNDMYLHLNDDDEWEMRKVLDVDKEQEILAGDIVLTSIKELEAQIAAWRVRDQESEAMLLHQQQRTEAAEASVARLAEAIGYLIAACRPFQEMGYFTHSEQVIEAPKRMSRAIAYARIALSISDVQLTETEHPS